MINSSTYLHIPSVIRTEKLSGLLELITGAEFNHNAVGSAENVDKSSLALDPASTNYNAIQKVVSVALGENPYFCEAILPRSMNAIQIHKYETGMAYNWHTDGVGHGDTQRDIAMTIFLNDPSEYEGGEIEFMLPTGIESYKLSAGDALCYPANQLHRVNPVTSGTRLVAVTWIQSKVKQVEQRNLLFDLKQLSNSLAEKGNCDAEIIQLDGIREQLLLMLADNKDIKHIPTLAFADLKG